MSATNTDLFDGDTSLAMISSDEDGIHLSFSSYVAYLGCME